METSQESELAKVVTPQEIVALTNTDPIIEQAYYNAVSELIREYANSCAYFAKDNNIVISIESIHEKLSAAYGIRKPTKSKKYLYLIERPGNPFEKVGWTVAWDPFKEYFTFSSKIDLGFARPTKNS